MPTPSPTRWPMFAERRPFTLTAGCSPRTALRHYARSLGLPAPASLAVLNERHGERSRGLWLYRDLYRPYVPTLAAILRGRWRWPEVKWEHSHGRWSFTDDVPAGEIIDLARRYVRYLVRTDEETTRIYDGALDAPKPQSRLHAMAPWPRAIALSAAQILEAVRKRLPELDEAGLAVMLPVYEPAHGEPPGRFVQFATLAPDVGHWRELRIAVRGPCLLARAAALARMPVLVELRIERDGAAEATTPVSLRDAQSAPAIIATMLNTFEHLGVLARDYVYVESSARP